MPSWRYSILATVASKGQAIVLGQRWKEFTPEVTPAPTCPVDVLPIQPAATHLWPPANSGEPLFPQGRLGRFLESMFPSRFFRFPRDRLEVGTLARCADFISPHTQWVREASYNCVASWRKRGRSLVSEKLWRGSPEENLLKTKSQTVIATFDLDCVFSSLRLMDRTETWALLCAALDRCQCLVWLGFLIPHWILNTFIVIFSEIIVLYHSLSVMLKVKRLWPPLGTLYWLEDFVSNWVH